MKFLKNFLEKFLEQQLEELLNDSWRNMESLRYRNKDLKEFQQNFSDEFLLLSLKESLKELLQKYLLDIFEKLL